MFGTIKAFSFDRNYSNTIIFSDVTMPVTKFTQYSARLSFKLLLKKLESSSKEYFKSKIRRKNLYMVEAELNKDTYESMKRTVRRMLNES